MTRIFPAFLARYPRVKLQVIATNRRVDLIDERIDVAIRVRSIIDSDAALTMRTLAKSRRILVASPALANRLGDMKDIAALASIATLGANEQAGDTTWELVGLDGQVRPVRHEPRLSCGDFTALREAAAAGLGVSLLPDHLCWPALKEGKLVRVFPDWYAPEGIVHLVFTTRRGLPPAVRALIDHLAERFGDEGLLGG
jgi:DNA-binding transcriptional LysR family regulator